ncbi:MAG: helix-turn-helix transcriptional regulator [Erysipelotrichaceae bacterium]|nr:helix-turn-helix transcriptional regulator [Erysipelotrichaceae bacterium]MCI9523938.1 helix-turn-helix transcriptional regulator [Erysipelotrichaceae bacterium]
MKINKLTLGEKIADKMADIGISNAELCKRTGITKTTLSEIISGTRDNPTSKILVSLSKGLNISVDYLLGLSDEPSVDATVREKAISTGIPSDVLTTLESIFHDDDYLDIYDTIIEFLSSPYIGKFFDTLFSYYATSRKKDDVYAIYQFDDLPAEEAIISSSNGHKLNGHKPDIIFPEEYIDLKRNKLMQVIDRSREMSKAQYLINKNELLELKKQKKEFSKLEENLRETTPNPKLLDYLMDYYNHGAISIDKKITKIEQDIIEYEKTQKKFYDQLDYFSKNKE